MILADIHDYVERRGQASLADIASHFDTPADALQGMLAVWVRKGKIHRRLATAACGSSCSQCESAATEIYVWGPEEEGEEARPSADWPHLCPTNHKG